MLAEAQSLLQARHKIEHATLQVEASPSEQCDEVKW